MGDLIFFAGFRLKRPCPGLRIRIRVGVPQDTTVDDRVVHPGARRCTTYPEGVSFAMDLQADKKVELDLRYTDEVGNETDGPATATVTYSVSDPALLALTDNGDGSAVAASVGPLGFANVHVDVDPGDGGAVVTGDLPITIVAGDAERVEIVPGAITEVTPDEAPPVP